MWKVNLLASLLFAMAAGLQGQAMPASLPGQNGAQTQSSDSQTPASNPNQEADYTPGAVSTQERSVPVPLPLNLDAGSLEFSSELERSNFLRGGVAVGTSYDDNLLSSNSQLIGGFTYTVMPNISLDISRPRLLWDLNYSGGFLVNQRFSAYNQSSHNAGIDLRYRLSPHVNVRVSDRFSLTSSFMDQLQGSNPGLATGVIQQPNQAIITPLARQTSDLGTAEITYQFSAGDMVGASGTYYDSRFGGTPTGASTLLNTRSEEADGFYSHRFTARNWSGIAYKFQRLNFNPAIEQTDTQSFLLFHTIYLQPRMQLAFFAGPEYSELNMQIVSTAVTVPFVTVVATPATRQNWLVSGGASFGWQGEHTSISLSAVRKVSDGGGFLTAVHLTSVSGGVRRQLARGTNLEVSMIYGDSRSLIGGSSTFSTIKSASGSLSWEQNLGRSFTATFGYARDYQQENTVVPPALNINHNRGWVTLGYQFSRPLGR